MFHTEELIRATFWMIIILSSLSFFGIISIIIMLKRRTHTIHTFKSCNVEVPHYIKKKLFNLSMLNGNKFLFRGTVLNVSKLISEKKNKTKDTEVNVKILSGHDKNVEQDLRMRFGEHFMTNILPSLLLEHFEKWENLDVVLLIQYSGIFPLVIFFDPECKTSYHIDATEIEKRLSSERITTIAFINGFEYKPME